MDSEQKAILDKLEAQCSKREYCVSEIRQKLFKALEGDTARADEVLESLLAGRFVDDSRYASAFAREKAALTGWGPVKIRYSLRAKGIAPSVIDAAIEEIDSGKAEEKMFRLLENKRKSLEGDPQLKLKLIRFMLSRGYEYSDIQEFI